MIERMDPTAAEIFLEPHIKTCKTMEKSMKKRRIPGVSPAPPKKETSTREKKLSIGCLIIFIVVIISIAGPNCIQFNLRVYRTVHLPAHYRVIQQALEKYHNANQKYPSMNANGHIPAVLYGSNAYLDKEDLKEGDDDSFRYYYLPEQDDYILFSAGPDKDLDLPPLLFKIMRDNIELTGDVLLISKYDPTNGINSSGDDYRSNNKEIEGNFSGGPVP